MIRQKFTAVFRERLDQIERDAHDLGLNFTAICREAGISRATPDRWRRQEPKTVMLVQRMEDIVERHRAELRPEGDKAE